MEKEIELNILKNKINKSFSDRFMQMIAKFIFGKKEFSKMENEGVFNSVSDIDNKEETEISIKKEESILKSKNVININKMINTKTAEKEYLEKEFTSLIEKEDFFNIHELVKAGYVKTTKQERLLDEVFVNNFFKDFGFNVDNFKVLNKLYEINFIFSEHIKDRLALAFLDTFDTYYFIGSKNDKNSKLIDIENFKKLVAMEKTSKKESDFHFSILNDIQIQDCANFFVSTYEYILNNPQKINQLFINFTEGKIKAYSYNSLGKKDERNHIYDYDIAIRLYNYFLKHFFNQEPNNYNIPGFYNAVLNIKNKIQTSKNEYLRKSISNFDLILADLKMIKSSPSPHMDKLLLLTKQAFVEKNIDNLIVEKQKEKVSSFSNKELSELSQNYLSKITEAYKIILDNKELVLADKLYIAEKMINERIPEVVTRFSAFDKTDRTEMKNINGKSPNDLCEESLENMLSHFQEMVGVIKETQLSDLSSFHRYTKSFKR